MMKTSIVMKLCCHKENKVEADDVPVGKRPPMKDHWPHIKSAIFLIYAVYYSIVTFRINSIRGFVIIESRIHINSRLDDVVDPVCLQIS